jgi:Family of unknown function (DUF6159)
MGKFSNTWSLMGASWQLLKKDKEILIFPLISGICCLAVLASFAAPVIMGGAWRTGGNGAAFNGNAAYATLFLFYFCNYFVIVFFNAAIVACAAIRMNGGDPTVADGLRAAFSRFHLIAGWAFLQATVGLVLRVVEDRSELLGRIVAGILGLAWTVTSFLVVPVLVVEEKGPVAALKESTELLKKTWGEQLIGNFSFGLVFFFLAIPAVLFIALGMASGSGTGVIVAAVLTAAYLIGLALVQSALQAIFQAALYQYARNGRVPEGFQAEFLENAISRK